MFAVFAYIVYDLIRDNKTLRDIVEENSYLRCTHCHVLENTVREKDEKINRQQSVIYKMKKDLQKARSLSLR